MGLVGTLTDGTRLQAIALCEFEGGLDASGEVAACDGEPRYRVIFADGTTMHACEEHAQQVWDADKANA